jgi:hypothetical protein
LTGQTGDNANAIINKQVANQFANNVIKNMATNLVSTGINSTINGNGLNRDSLANALTNAFITAGLAQGANSIGGGLADGTLNAFTHQLAHAMLGCAGGVATSGSSGELAAKYATETLGWDKEKALNFAKVMSAASGLIVVQDGNDAGAVNLANTMGVNAAENNYLTHKQDEQKAKELAECKSKAACALIGLKWAGISAEQDLAFGLGVTQGLGISAIEAGIGTWEVLGSPIETLTALKEALTQDDAFKTMTAAKKKDLLNRIDTMKSEYQAGAWGGAKNAGIEFGLLIAEVASVATGVAGAGKGVVTVVNKITANVAKTGTGAAAKLGKASDALLPEADFAGRGTVRPDLVEHLTDAAKKGKQINGGHDMNSFNATLNQAGGKVLSKIEQAPGIYEVEYQLPNSSKSFPKTIYDPAMYPNMPNMVNEAAAKGLYQYHKTGLVEQTVVLNGIKFTVNVKFPKGQPAITTVYPSGVVK